jgi:hypothetical protein
MRIALVLLAIAACDCSGGHGTPDGTPVDAPCVPFMAEYVDWNSSNTGSFCGILMATWTIHGTTTVDHTAPNGRVILCLPDEDKVTLDVTPPTAGSQCTVPTGQTYNIAGTAIVDKAVLAAGGQYSARVFTMMVAQTFNFNPAKAHVLVFVTGTPRPVSLTGNHDTALQYTDATGWVAGNAGTYVYFPNIDPTPGTATVSMTGTAVGVGDIPLTAGAFTYVSVVAN